jgi:transcriptional regulator with XRE-family HTH domain
MISPIAQRIGKVIVYQKISRREFASRLGYASSEKINRLFRKDGAKPGFDIVADIANRFVNINVEWLITGRGEMLKGNIAEPEVEQEDDVSSNYERDILQKLTEIERAIRQIELRLTQKGM